MPAETFQRVLPMLRGDLDHESDRIGDAGPDHCSGINDAASPP